MDDHSPFSVTCEKVKLMAVKRSGRNFILNVGRVPLCQGCDEIVQGVSMLGCLVAMSSRSNDHETTYIIIMPVTLAPFANRARANEFALE